MPALNKTVNYGLNQWTGNEYPKRQDFVDDNAAIDAALAPTADPTQVPSGNAGKLGQWVSWLANRIKAITGGTNWWDNPVATLAGLNTSINDHKTDYTLQVPYGGVTTNSGNAYAIAAPTISSLTAGMAISVKINADSSGAATLNWNGRGAVAIKKANGIAVSNLKVNGVYTLRYDGTNFILQGEGASGNATASDLLSGKTASVDAGDIVGTIPSKAAQTYTPGTTNQTIGAGQYLSGAQTIAGDADLIPSNIKVGVNIFGVVGTVGNSTSGSQTFTASGTFTVPNGVNTINFFITAGGGGGGAYDYDNTSDGSSGGAGATALYSGVQVTPGQNITIAVGAGGLGGSGRTNGGSSSFNGTVYVTGGIKGTEGSGSAAGGTVLVAGSIYSHTESGAVNRIGKSIWGGSLYGNGGANGKAYGVAGQPGVVLIWWK